MDSRRHSGQRTCRQKSWIGVRHRWAKRFPEAKSWCSTSVENFASRERSVSWCNAARQSRWVTGNGRNSRNRCSALRSEEHTSELQSLAYLVCRLLLEKKKKKKTKYGTREQL